MAENKWLKTGVWIVIAVFFTIVILGVGLGVATYGLDETGKLLLKYFFYGEANIKEMAGMSGFGLLITALMVWLIIFTAFGDIFENFSAFSEGIAWLIAFGVAVIAANTKLLVKIFEAMITLFAGFGSFAILIALGTSIFVFLVIHLGTNKFTNWIQTRKEAIDTAKGRRNIVTGVETAAAMGVATKKAGKNYKMNATGELIEE